MKASQIRELSLEEKVRKASDLKEELFNLRFQHEIGQLENPQKMKQIKREIARVKTIIKESELNQEIG
ncbi:MAG: 50S ribosomal protein L29 [Deltaproteobacteria bacterium]|jgi:large subunit ribosomal protein L29|nr:50S ribosomal protein L29 [Deltaproteobacteria bacterium]OQY11375.1 MAG: 50S ribosomal protein L29 [Desulfobacteraceae bacterium 4572_187]MBW1958632.1 50S ribosomal protein L29 [Deltaproteobacteria bacterium]MBW2013705.1 50S ribosomal protein L29 [Deltaproteobacteria bacterium]MBW2089018.1 50S ribosomal protein L29 [Deltaproteobacteria bacterium]